MRKTFIIWSILLISIFLYTTTTVLAEDKSYKIEHVDIYVNVDKEGVMHVSELSTYTFHGTFNGTERSILADVANFKGYKVEHSTNNPEILTEELEELTIENEDDLYRIHIPAQDEQKTVLYTYDLSNEIKKYTDVADVLYDFYPSSNNVDLGTLSITWEFAREVNNMDIHAYVHGDEQGTIEYNGSRVVYEHEHFTSGMSAEVRIVFPADAVPEMPVKKDKQMGETIIQAEQIKREKKDMYEDRLASIVPLVIFSLIALIVGFIRWYIIHPNHFRLNKQEDPRNHLTFLEETDALFVSYMQGHGYVSNMQTALISALLSLKRREIISMKEVPSEKDQEKMTYAFYWNKTKEPVDAVDAYLRTWLFTEEEGGEQFLFETIIFDEDEHASIQEEKEEHFTSHYNEWINLVKNRKAFSGWYERYRPFKYVSTLLTVLSFLLFYYALSISPISSLLFQWSVGGIAVLVIMSLLWSANKWVLSMYYFILIAMLFISSSWSVKLLPILGFMLVSWIGLLIISSRRWDKTVAKLIRLVHIAKRLFKRKEYPVDEDEVVNERRVELAITLGMGEKYAEQIGKELPVQEKQRMNTPLVNNPNFAGAVFHPSNLVYYSALSSGAASSTSMSSSPTSGSGGAGAF